MTEQVFCHLIKKVGAWQIRIDNRHGQKPYHKEHVHISRKSLKGEYSWNKDGTRHDKHRFPASEQYIARAKKIAAEALNVDQSTLQLITLIDSGSRVSVSEICDGTRTRSLLSIYIHKDEHLVLFVSSKGLFFVVSSER